MSLLKWITGGTFESNVEIANEYFENKNFGEARLSFQKALKKQKGVEPKQVEQIKEKISECSKQLAFKRIEKAKEYFSLQNIDGAFDCLDDALEICHTDEISEIVDTCKNEFERQQEEEEAEGHEMTREELLAVIGGTWSMLQASEFSGYSEQFYDGMMLAHEGKHEDAVETIKDVLQQVKDTKPVFIYLELGRQQYHAKQFDDAQASLETFIDAATKIEDVKEELVVAYNLLANIHIQAKNNEQAEACLMKAFRANPDNHVPLLHLGIFLRDCNELKRSKRTLENAMDTMGAMHPDMRVFRELGHTCLALDERQDAKEFYKAVISLCCQRGTHEQYDPEAAVPLAKLHEEDEEFQDAADIYRHLVNGYDEINHFVYNLEAARLLKKTGAQAELVENYIETAKDLATTEDQKNLISSI